MARINFEVDEKQVKYIDELVDQTGLKTKVNLFNTALTLFEWAVRERLAGRAICSQDVNTAAIREIEMPGFPPLPPTSAPWQREKRATAATMTSIAHWGIKERKSYFIQLANWLPALVETPQQAKEVKELFDAFGAEIKPEAQEKLKTVINSK